MNIRAAVLKNKFYVGSSSVFDRSWGRPTLSAALERAKELAQHDGREVFVVQIIRIVPPDGPPERVLDMETVAEVEAQ